LSVDVDGKAQGTWFVTGRDEYLANISVREGSKVRIISFANSVIELSRQGESELELVGSFARVNGRTSPVVLKKTSGSSDAVGANLAKALVRHWEGDIRYISITSADPRRTLYIDSIIRKDGQWIASGRYGITGRSLGRVSIEVGTTGNRPWIRFATGAHSIVRLQMVGDRHMSGSIKFKGTGWGDSEHIEPALRLERID
jgi:hypothetical protein